MPAREPVESRAHSLVGRNCLVVGPAGSGKLTLVYGLAAQVTPGARQFLFDWEVEESQQRVLLDRLRDRWRQPSDYEEIWILRHLDSLHGEGLQELLFFLWETTGCGSPFERPCLRAIYATAFNATRLLSDQRTASLFPWRFETTGVPRDRLTLERLVWDILAELNKRHGNRIRRIHHAVIEYLAARPWDAHFLEMHSILERAFLTETGDCLTPRSLSRAMVPVSVERMALAPPLTVKVSA